MIIESLQDAIKETRKEKLVHPVGIALNGKDHERWQLLKANLELIESEYSLPEYSRETLKAVMDRLEVMVRDVCAARGIKPLSRP